MLFKIANLIILADDESEARSIFTEATGQSQSQSQPPIQVLLSEGQRYTTMQSLKETNHVSETWIGIDSDGDYFLDLYQDSDSDLDLDPDPNLDSPAVIHQLPETEQLVERLNGPRSTVERLVNSVNFSYDTLYEFSEEYPDYSWVLDHYSYKQKLIRDGHVMISNDGVDGD